MSQIKLPSSNSVLSVDSDILIQNNLEQSAALLPQNDLESIVSSYQVYLDERSRCKDYRIYGNLISVSTNVLCQLDGDLGFMGVENARNFDITSQKYERTLDETLFQKNGWYYYTKKNDKCTHYELEPNKTRYDFQNTWDICVTYPAAKDLQKLYFNTIPLSDGLAIMGGGTTVLDGKFMTYFVCALSHNLSIGDFINVYSSDGFVGNFAVHQLGLPDNTYKKNIFIIDQIIPNNTIVLGKKFRFKKIIGTYESEYYSRWFKRIASNPQVFKTAFAQNIYEDKDYSYTFDSINLDFLDYLNRPLTELYISVIKKSEPDFWTKILSGTNTYLSNINYDHNTIYDGSIRLSIESNIQGNENYYFGDIVEYNEKILLEEKLNFAVHILNTKDRISNDLFESLYYVPHYQTSIKQFSTYINSDDGIQAIPPHAVSVDGILQWRDILETDIPYLNKHIYVYGLNNVFFRRQDPCKTYGLGTNALIDGRCIDMDGQKIIDVNKIC